MNLSTVVLLGGLLGLTISPTRAQFVSCKTGKIDPRVANMVDTGEGMTLEQMRAIPFDTSRKDVPPDLNPVPENKLQRKKITADSISVIVYRPDRSQGRKLPVIVYFHGGGWVTPLLPLHYCEGYDRANALGALVIQVDYPVAPEHRFPSAVTAGYAAFEWVTAHAGELGGDTSKLILCGGSAGANIATGITLVAIDRGLGKRIKMVSLLSPPLDNPVNSPYGSYVENGKGYPISRNEALWAFEMYVGPAGADTSDYRLFPMKAKTLGSFPPTLIFNAEFEVLRDEGRIFANRLRAEGVPVFYRCFPGIFHALMGLPSDAQEYVTMNEDTRLYMKKYLRQGPRPAVGGTSR